MIRLSKTVRFEAAHYLPNYKGAGNCHRMHGHGWICTIVVEGDTLQDTGSNIGMLADYYDIGKPLKELVDTQLDHTLLNDILLNPTSENLAVWIFEKLKSKIPLLTQVSINETCTSQCDYLPYKKADHPHEDTV